MSFATTISHFQNGISEKDIRTVVEMARTMLFFSREFWPQGGINDEQWPYAMIYAADLLKHLPGDSVFPPSEIFSKTRGSKHILS